MPDRVDPREGAPPARGVGSYERPASTDRARTLRQLLPWLVAALVLLLILVWVLHR